jgi:putative ABC transport system permease protein
MLRSYLKLAIKVLLRRKFFTAVSLFGISFTLVVLTVVVAFLDHLLAPLPPETRLDRTLAAYRLRIVDREGRARTPEINYLMIDSYARGIPGVERLSLMSTARDLPAYVAANPVICVLKRTDADFWKVLDFTFVEGGPYADDDVANGRFVAVVTEATRRRFFGSEPALGKTIEVDAQRFRVVGVVPNVSRLRTVPFAEIWVPHTTDKSDAYRSSLRSGGYMAVFLARSRADFPAIRSELDARLRGVPIAEESQGRLVGVTAVLETAAETVARVYSGGLSGLQYSAGLHLGAGPGSGGGGFYVSVAALALLFMLLPTLNLVNLNVSRILERSSEIGVRKAFGATSRTLVGQFVVENVVLTVIGGLIGFVFAYAVLNVLTSSGVIAYTQFHMNVRVFLSGVAIAVFFGVFSGVYPAWRMSRLQPVEALKGGAR